MFNEELSLIATPIFVLEIKTLSILTSEVSPIETPLSSHPVKSIDSIK